jgi:hypothetical protein
MTTDTINAAAYEVSRAFANLQRVNADLATAEVEHGRIEARTAALDSKRREIVSRRQAGDARPNDGADLELIAADREGLSSILVEAEAAVGAAQKLVQKAKQALNEAQRGMQIVEDSAALDQLVAHAGRLDALLLATAGQISETQARLGHTGRPVWAPNPELFRVLRKLTAAVGGL